MAREAGKAARSDDVRRRNRATLIAALRDGGPRSRTALAGVTGLSGATVSAIGGALIEEGVIAPVAPPETQGAGRGVGSGGRGRPQAPLGLNPARASAAAVVVSGRAVDGVITDYAGSVIGRSARGPLPFDASPVALALALAEQIDAARPPRPFAPLGALTIAFQGVSDAEARRVVWSPIIAARRVDFAGPLAPRCGGRVAVMNDAAMIAEALLRRRAGRDLLRDAGADLAVLLVGRGVGMGLVLDGAAAGGRVSSAMEFGHMTHLPGGAPCACGRRGCVEAYAADYALLRAAGWPADGDPAALADAARAGDAAARAAFAQAGAALGYGLGRLFALLGPLPVALAGSGAAAADLLRAPMAEALEQALAPELSGPLDLIVAGDATALALEGAAAHALRRLDAALAAGEPVAGGLRRGAAA